jgi:hypothetical protein
MSTITVKRELPAMRCEICHQADCFTPETGVCTRCAGLTVLQEKPTPVAFAGRGANGFLADYLRRQAEDEAEDEVNGFIYHRLFVMGIFFVISIFSPMTLRPVMLQITMLIGIVGMIAGVIIYRKEIWASLKLNWRGIGIGLLLVLLLLTVLVVGWKTFYFFFPTPPISEPVDDF